MKRIALSLTLAVVLFAGVGLMAGAGVASADHTNEGIPTAADNIGIVVGVVFDAHSADSPARATNGGPLGGPLLAKNPLCPAHWGRR